MRATSLLGLSLLSLALVACGDDSSSLDTGRLDAGSDSNVERDARVDAPRPDAGGCDLGSTIGRPCRTSGQCTDLCFCNGIESCQGGLCVAGDPPCDDGIGCSTDTCDEAGTRCDNQPDDTLCDDEDQCSGEEFCDLEVGCVDGVPLSCTDGDSCTIDRCDSVMGCTNTLRDVDGDGFADSRCEGGDDCNDDPMIGVGINPGATEICDNEVDDDCDGQSDLFDADCVPTNDTCATPTTLGARGFYGWSTHTLADDYELSCESTSFSDPLLDAVFRFDLAVESDVRFSSNGPVQTSIELRGPGNRSVCEDDLGTALACDRKTSNSGDGPEIEIRRLAAGAYYVIAQSPNEGLYGLTFEATPTEPPPPSDSCATAPDVGSGGVFRGEFAELTDRHPAPTCRSLSTGYAEAAYRLSLTADSDVSVRATGADSTGSTRAVAVQILTDCALPAEAVACEGGSTAEIVVRPLPAGDYFIVVEADSSTAATYGLQVDVRPPSPRNAGDVCAMAIDITDTSATLSITDLENDGGTGCGGGDPPWREAYFTVDVAARSSVELQVSTGGIHLLSLGTMCGVASSESLCRSGTPSSTETVTLDPGTYTVTVAVPTATGSLSASSTVTPL